jgi:hypothetical protein
VVSRLDEPVYDAATEMIYPLLPVYLSRVLGRAPSRSALSKASPKV